MKKTVKFAAIALVAMSLMVACKSKTAEVVAEDTMPVEEMVVETIDTIEEVAEEVVVEEPVKKVAKKSTKQETVPSVKPTNIDKAGSVDQSAKGSAKKVEQTVAPTKITSEATAAPEKKKGK